jgi:hypothetical protein
MYFKRIFAALVLTVIFFGCEEDAESRIFKHNAVGTPGDVLVVMGEELWEGPWGDTLKHYLQADYEVLPQSEPIFRLTQIPPAALGRTTKRSRNLILVNLSKEYKKTGIAVEHDTWSQPQLLIRIRANTKEELLEILAKNGEGITDQFQKATLERQAIAFKNTANKQAISKLNEKFNIYMSIPAHFKLAKETENFLWIRNETPRLSQGILIWSYPYTNEKQLKKDKLIEFRDSVTMHHVPGPKPETSFMTSEKRVMPIYKTRELDGNFCVEIRGLWRVEGAFMGGPFVNYSVVDEKRNRIVTVDVFVYAGMQEKRNFIREVEAIANTLKFTD